MPEPKATIGQRLKNIRVERRLSIEKAAEATRIRVPYLQALEEDNYSVMASAAQGRGFLKIYAGYLDLDLDAAMQDLQRADDSAEVPPAAASPESVAVAPAPDAPPPAPSEPTADRRPFWARLLRRSAPEADAAPLPKPAATEEPVPAPPEPEPEPISQSRPEPEQTLVSVKKTAAKKPRSAAKVSKSKGGTAEADTKKPAGKKKRTVEEAVREEVTAEVPAVSEPEEISRAEATAEAPVVSEPAQTFPKLEVTQLHEAPAAEAEPHLNVWTRLGLRVSRPRPPEVRAEAEGEVAAQVEEPVEVIVPRVESGAFRSSDEMFAEVGARLRERRETLNLRHEEIERHIHLRAHYLRALEEGDFGGLPSAVQTRGMLANYAAFLGLDVDELLLRFADVLQARHRERHPLPYGARGKPAPAAPASPPLFRSFLTVDLLGIGLALFLAAFLIWGVSFVAQKKEQARAATPVMLDALIEPTSSAAPGTPAPTSILLDLGNLTATLEPLEPPGALPTAPEGVNVQVNIIALERTFLRVTVDGKVAFEGRVNPGTAYPFDAADQIEVLAGSGAALRVTYNQRDMGLLGGFGEVVNLIYRADGMVTPTPTIGPSPTVTPTPTATFTPTMTPSSTRTPTSTPTP